MPFDIGDWNQDGPSSGATGALKRIRQYLEAAPTPDAWPDAMWVDTVATEYLVKSIVQGIWEEVQANAQISGVTSGTDTVVGTID